MDASYTTYAGIDAAANEGDIHFTDAVSLIQTSSELAAFTARARAILAAQGKGAAYAAFKTGAKGITWGGRFTHRANANLQAASGAVFIDIDGLANIQAAAAERDRVSAYPFTAITYISLSGLGVHSVIRVAPTPATPSEYKAAWTAAMTALGYDPAGTSDADKAVSDMARLAFIAHDGGAYANAQAQPLRWYMPTDTPQATPPPKRAYTGVGGELLTLEEAVAAAGARQVGGAYRARCLVHNGVSEDSLSISSANGELLVHCFAECEPTDILAALRQAAGKPQSIEFEYCAACNRDGVRKPGYAVCYECKRNEPRKREYAPPAPLRECNACGGFLTQDSGHRWDNCEPEFQDLSPKRQREHREAMRRARFDTDNGTPAGGGDTSGEAAKGVLDTPHSPAHTDIAANAPLLDGQGFNGASGSKAYEGVEWRTAIGSRYFTLGRSSLACEVERVNAATDMNADERQARLAALDGVAAGGYQQAYSE